jgi:DNA invertase Pin-like site-specific DNA recombinase
MPVHPTSTPRCVIHCRVSTQKQAYEGESLDVQASMCRSIAENKGWILAHEPWKESFSGRKSHRPVFEEILAFIDANPRRIQYYVFRAIDRMTRGGTTAYDHMKRELTRRGVSMIDSQGLIQPVKNTLEDLGFEYDWSRVSPSEIAEVVVATTAKSEVSTILTRLIGQEIRLRQQGYKVRRPTDGFINAKIYVDGRKRTIEQPDPTRAGFFIAMFEMRKLGTLSDMEICERINAMGYRTRPHNKWNADHTQIIGRTTGTKLSPKRLQEIIQRPIYCGIICEKWTRNQPIRAAYPGLVSIDLFNAANRSKVHVLQPDDGSLAIIHDYHPRALARPDKNNPAFPFKSVVACSACRSPLMASSPRGRGGKRYPTYHCARNHKYVGVKKKLLEDALEAYVAKLRFRPQTIAHIREDILDVYAERHGEIQQAAQRVAATVDELECRKAEAVRAFKFATTDLMRRSLEAEADDYDRQIAETRSVGDRLAIDEGDIAGYLKDTERVLARPSVLLDETNAPTQRQARFSLVFPSLPTYEEIASRTAKLQAVFCLSSDREGDKSGLVHSPGFNWNQLEQAVLHWKEIAHLLALDDIAPDDRRPGPPTSPTSLSP